MNPPPDLPPPPEVPPGIMSPPPREAFYYGEPEPRVAVQNKRWAMVERLRKRSRRERRQETRHDRWRLEHIRHAYVVAAQFMINAITDNETNLQIRDQRRQRMEHRMRVDRYERDQDGYFKAIR